MVSEDLGVVADQLLDFLVQTHPHIGVELGVDV
jgi:hypothetical protein